MTGTGSGGRLRAAGRPVIRAIRRIVAARRGRHACALGELPPGEIRVFYGYPRVPGPDDRAVGGIIKLQGLARTFPNSPGRFNVLYLVTSQLPEEVLTLARVARERGARIVVNQNGVAYPGWHGPGWERVNQPMILLLKLADHIVYQSRFCKESADRYLGQPRAAWTVLYNPVDTERFRPEPAQRDPAALTLLLGGSQDFRYRLEIALRVLAKVARIRTDVRLLVTGRLPRAVGSGGAESDARSLARELGVRDRVTFLGPYTQAEAPGIFQRADILLHTKYNDPCPTVVIEAMASGLPVVYSKSGGVPELVGEEAGVGIATEVSWERDYPPDPDIMADAVLLVADRCDAMGDAARQRAVERFGLDSWIERHRRVFAELVS